MRLIRCYIENFGKLSHFSYDFSQGLNVVLQENGFGKTTLAAFLKAMFYGLSGTGKTSVLLNERKRYKPWQGGAFGGNLVFEQEGKRYLIERFFGEKDKEETFALFDADTGAESVDYTINIGEELFSLDAQAFVKSIFMPQQELATSANDSLLAKLTGENQDEKDMGHYESAISSLEKEKKELVKMGEKGRIWELKHQITRLQMGMQELVHLEENEEAYRKRLKEVEKTLEGLSVRREELSKELELAGAYEKNQAIFKHFQSLKQALDAKEEASRNAGALFPENRREELPNEEDFSRIFEKLSHLHALSQEASAKHAQCEALSQSVDEAAREKEHAARREKEMGYREDTPKRVSYAVYYTGAFLLAALAVGLLFVKVPVGLALLALALVLFGILWKQSMAQKRRAQEELAKGEQQRTFLHKEYEGAAKRYEKKLDEWKNVKAQQEMCAKEKEALEEEIRHFIQELQPDTIVEEQQFATRLSELRQQVNQCCLLKVELEKSKREYLEFQEENRSVLQDASKNAGENVIEDMTPKSLSQVKQEDDACSRRQQQLVEERSQILRQLEKFSEGLEQGQEDLAQLEHAQLELQELEERYQILDKTVTYLEKAKERFSLRYLEEIKGRFQEYMELLNEGTTMESVLDTKLKLKVTQTGSKKDVDCFSAGYRDLLYLCLRFALADTLCGQEGFLILDDPFVNLDKDKIEQGLAFLEKLSRKHQIIYLTCHESRCGG